MSLLITAILNDDIPSAFEFLKQNKHISWSEHVSKAGSTAVHLAAKRGYLELIKELVGKGCPWTETDNLGYAPIYYANKITNSEVYLFLAQQFK